MILKGRARIENDVVDLSFIRGGSSAPVPPPPTPATANLLFDNDNVAQFDNDNLVEID